MVPIAHPNPIPGDVNPAGTGWPAKVRFHCSAVTLFVNIAATVCGFKSASDCIAMRKRI